MRLRALFSPARPARAVVYQIDQHGQLPSGRLQMQELRAPAEWRPTEHVKVSGTRDWMKLAWLQRKVLSH